MAIKKATPVKTDRSSDKKIAVKKVIKKAAATPTKKVAAKKAIAPKKVATPKKVAKKAAKKAVKLTPEKSIKNSFLKKGEKSVQKLKPESKAKKSADQLLVDTVVEGIQEVKGKDITILDLRGIHNRVCDYYVICQADSSTQVNAIAGSVEVMVKKKIGERPYHSEGFQNSEWILVDYVTVVVHIFQSEVRDFYNLESLWADAEITRIPD